MTAPLDLGLIFLERAAARLILVEANDMSVADAIQGLVPPFEALVGRTDCICVWDLVEQWEATYPPLRRKWRAAPC